MTGVLYLCPTPIGNLDDITLRTLKVLKEVDVIAAEDTRHSKKLLSHYEIHTPLVSYHEHNEKQRGSELIERLQKGEAVAVISDAGMPGISDPGNVLIRLAQEHGISYTILPGANAAITAYVASGFSAERFQFIGFLPKKNKDLEEVLSSLDHYEGVTIFYEAPHRIVKTLETFARRWPERRLALCRELTKQYEEYETGTTTSLLATYQKKEPRGEYVIVLDRGEAEETDVDVAKELQKLMDEGYRKSEAVSIVSKTYDLPKNDVYRISLEL